MPVVVHPRVSVRHPEFEEEDAIHAWVYAVECAERMDFSDWPAYAALGYDRDGRLLELLAALQEDGSILIYHTMTPPSKKMMTETFGPERGGNEQETTGDLPFCGRNHRYRR